jgi:hypothetical protein
LMFVCCDLEVCATGCSLVQRSPTECGVSEYDLETSIMRKTWPTGVVEPYEVETQHRVIKRFTFSSVKYNRRLIFSGI